MLKHYIKIAVRNFRANKVIFTGNIITLCLGTLCISLLFSYVHNELSMDDFHNDEKEIYMVTMKSSSKSEWISPFGFKYNDYPEIENATSIINYFEDEVKLKHKNYTYTPKGIVADSSFLKIFNFKMAIGNRATLLKDAEAIILSEAYSKKMFGDTNPIGQEVQVKMHMHQGTHTVKGIVKVPVNSSLKFDYIIPNANKEYGRRGMHFINVKKGFDKEIFNKKIINSNNNVPNFYPQLKESITKIVGFNELYFSIEYDSMKKRSLFSTGNKNNVDILLIIIFIILFITTLNYSNLQIVSTNLASKNIIVSKVNGAQKKHLFYRKIIENLILIGIVTLIISVAYNYVLPFFNDFVKVSLGPPIWKVITINIIILLTIITIGLIYPVIAINRFSVIKKANQNLKFLKGKNVIVVVQYILAFVLLISSIIVDRQLQLMLKKDLGFNSNNIIKIKLYHEPPYDPQSINWSNERKAEEFKKTKEIPQYINDKLASFSTIKNISQGNSPINTFSIDWKRKGDNSKYQSLNSINISPNHLNLFDLKVIEGQFFQKNITKQRGKQILINEAAKLHFGITDISKTKILNKYWSSKEGYQIIGVVKDFNYEHLSKKPKPLIMVYFGNSDSEYFIQFHKNKVQEGIQQIEEVFNTVNPHQTFKYSFLSDEISALYQKEKRLATVYTLFTIIALLISAIGLFIIALYDTQRRTKEIGVRKVNGATIKEIVLMLNKDFIKWVVIAILIASPISYYLMSSWLENFAYKTAISWWVFGLAGVFTLVLALLTVSWQSYRAATNNPVESLRDE